MTIEITRRTALKAASIMGAFLAAPGVFRPNEAQAAFSDIPFDASENRQIVVVGAGVAGLTAAYVAAKAGFKVMVIEADNRYGGRSLTVRPDPDAVPRGDQYKEWWFDKYNPHRLFPKMYATRYAERKESPTGGTEELGRFDIVDWPGTPEGGFNPVEMFLNAGPGRIPSNHTRLLDLCQEIGVRLEPYTFLSASNLMSSPTFNDGEAVQWREINYSLMGHLAEIMVEAVEAGDLLDKKDRKLVLNMLQQFGDLNSEYKFKGSANVGYAQQPGGWQTPWSVNEPVSIKEILKSGFIGEGDAEQTAGSFLFNPNHIL